MTYKHLINRSHSPIYYIWLHTSKSLLIYQYKSILTAINDKCVYLKKVIS